MYAESIRKMYTFCDRRKIYKNIKIVIVIVEFRLYICFAHFCSTNLPGLLNCISFLMLVISFAYIYIYLYPLQSDELNVHTN